ncbi:hypothetical protein ACFVOK_03840 [Streptomyces sp. NPDC057798]|uniref:hypothetical protein n=1 Tax=Streptomyces sp. NPDC057798 TaxID=3346252 RepID=UPI0036BF63A9
MLPNAWDTPSARVVEDAGAPALAPRVRTLMGFTCARPAFRAEPHGPGSSGGHGCASPGRRTARALRPSRPARRPRSPRQRRRSPQNA